MITYFFQDPLTIRIIQAAMAGALVCLVMLMARSFRIHLFKESSLAMLRGLLQVVGVGLLLFAVFKGPSWLSLPLLVLMVGVGTQIASRRAQGLPKTRRVIFVSIGGAAGGTLLLMVLLGVIETRSSALLPIGSMLIANAMNTVSLTLERLQSELRGQVGRIEAALALGAPPFQAIAPMVQASVQASLIPRIDTMRSLGIVWIPGLMTGMLLAGEDPLQSALYQFVIIVLILGVGALASLSSALLIRPALFGNAEQLQLPPLHAKPQSSP